MRTALMVLALLAAPAFASQSVWKWVDEKGVTHYSDRPVPGATKIEVSSGSRADTVDVPPAASRSSSSSKQPPAPPAVTYREIEIWKPADQEVIPNTGGIIDVRVRLDPALQRNHSLYLYLNGKLVEGVSPTSLDFTLRDVPRGLHTLIAVIHDGSGKRIQESRPVSFTVRQESIVKPPVGPALRTPPKPRGQSANKIRTSQPSYAALNGQRPPLDPRTNAPVKTKK